MSWVLFKGVVKDEVQLISSLFGFVFPRHQVAIHEHDTRVIEVEADHDSTLVPAASPDARLDLRRFQVGDPAQKLVLHEEPNVAADHAFGHNPHVPLLWVLYIQSGELNRRAKQLFPLIHLCLILSLEHVHRVELHDLLESYDQNVRGAPSFRILLVQLHLRFEEGHKVLERGGHQTGAVQGRQMND